MNQVVDQPPVGPHRFLQMDDRALTRERAAERVHRCLAAYGVNVDGELAQFADPELTITGEHTTAVTVRHSDLVDQTRVTGVVPHIDRNLWARTRPYATLAATTDAAAAPLQLSNGVHTTEPLETPGIITNDVVGTMLEDVLFYRREACRLSELASFDLCFRAYRAYLGSCVSVIDAFLNQAAWYALNDPARAGNLDAAQHRALANRRASIARKLETWPAAIFGSALTPTIEPVIHFHQLREARNEIVHVNNPDFNFSLRRAAGVLNRCSAGVGGLLVTLYGFAGQHPSVAALAVAHASTISFVDKPRL